MPLRQQVREFRLTGGILYSVFQGDITLSNSPSYPIVNREYRARKR